MEVSGGGAEATRMRGGGRRSLEEGKLRAAPRRGWAEAVELGLGAGTGDGGMHLGEAQPCPGAVLGASAFRASSSSSS